MNGVALINALELKHIKMAEYLIKRGIMPTHIGLYKGFVGVPSKIIKTFFGLGIKLTDVRIYKKVIKNDDVSIIRYLINNSSIIENNIDYFLSTAKEYQSNNILEMLKNY